MSRDGIAFGRYTLLRKLGAGGMGEVWLARQAGPAGFERLVAVKQLLPELAGDGSLRKLFLDEARIAATLSHPGIAHTYELGEVEGTWFIALEYVFGEDLSHVRERAEEHAGGVPLPYAARLVADLCAALDYAHNRKDEAGRPLGIVHRDVSPQNVLLSFEGQVKLVDFGIARAMNAHLGAAGQTRGKLAYMAPEQLARDGAPDGRADVFAAGIVLRELVGERPVPDALARAIAAATAPTAASRLTAAALQEELESYLASERWRVGQRELAAYMAELFGERPMVSAAAVDAGGPATATLTVEQVLGYLEANRAGLLPGAKPAGEAPPASSGEDGTATAIAAVPATAIAEVPATAISGVPRLPRRLPAWLIPVGIALVVLAAIGAMLIAAFAEPDPVVPMPSPSSPAPEPATAPAPTPVADGGTAALVDPSPAAPTASAGAQTAPTPPTAPEPAPPTPTPPTAPEPAPPTPGRATPKPSRPAKPEPRSAAAKKLGELTLDSEPWSEVRLDGRKLGVTPLAHVRLKSGTYTLELANPDTGRRTKRKVTIRAGEETVLRVRF